MCFADDAYGCTILFVCVCLGESPFLGGTCFLVRIIHRFLPTMQQDTPEVPRGIAKRRWVVVVHVNSAMLVTHPHLYMLPQVQSNFGKAVLDTLQAADWNCVLIGKFYYKDVQDNIVVPIKHHTPRARTRQFMAGAIPGTVVYYYTTAEGPASHDKVEEAVRAWNEANLESLTTSLAACQLSGTTPTLPSSETISATLPSSETISATSGALVSPPKFAFAVVAAPHVKAKPKPAKQHAEKTDRDEKANTEKESTNHVNKVEPKKHQANRDAKQAKQDDAKKDLSKASKRKHDLVDAAMKLAEAITKATQTQQTLKQAEQDVQEAKRLHVEAQELVETLKKGILGEL